MKEARSKKKRLPVTTKKQSGSSNQPSSSNASLLLKRSLLFLIAIVLLASYFSIGYTKSWFNDKILAGWKEFDEQKDNVDIESRMTTRFGNDYTITKSLADFLIKRNRGHQLLLVPPNDYFTANKIQYKIPEPAIFYYFSGVKTVWANSPEAYKATWYLSISNGELILDSIMSKALLDSVIDQFRSYKISL